MFSLQSTSFKHEGAIPKKYTGQGDDISPELTWSGFPPETKEFAIICDDPDAPTPEPWVHWVIYKIPADVTHLKEGLPQIGSLSKPEGTMQGKNSWNAVGYRGPLPPAGSGEHHYYFTIYALTEPLHQKVGLEKRALLKEMEGKVLDKAVLVGTYHR